MLDLKCKSYTVDQSLLKMGVPVEELEKRNEKIIVFDYEKQDNLHKKRKGLNLRDKSF